MTRDERQLKAVEQEMERYSQEAQAIWKQADEDDRETTNEERGEVEKHLKAIEDLKTQRSNLQDSIAVYKRTAEIGRKIGASEPSEVAEVKNYPQPMRLANFGEMFVNSPQFKSIQAKGFSGEYTTGMVDLETKGTLLTGPGAPGTGSGGGLLPVPDVVPGLVEKLFQPLTVADLIATGTTETNTLRYVVEGTATSGAAGVAEAGAKPESTLGYSTVDEPVKKIATMLVISDEQLEDASQVQSIINARLALFVKIEEERQLVLGGGTNDLIGINGRTGVNIYAGGTVDANSKVLFKAINGTRGSSFLEPDAVIMNPTDWQETRLEQDSAGQYYGGGPFHGQYGQGGVDPISGQLTGAMDTIWNKPVVVTTAIGAGTALLGAFRTAAQIFRRGGLTVEATNSHSTYFANNLVAIRAEQRLGLAVYRPSAFTRVLFQ